MPQRPLAKVLLFIGILLIGIALFAYMVATKKAPSKKHSASLNISVATIPAISSESEVVVSAMGSVIPSRSVTILPQVTGKITQVDKKLVPGGLFKKGQIIAKIDPSDYNLAVRAQESNVALARQNLAMEEGNHAAAKIEWSLIEDNIQPTEAGKRLAMRDIQLESAKTALKSAQSSLEKAQLDRSRTTIRAPFNAFVTEKNIDIGQVVSGQTPIVTLVDSDTSWVQVYVPLQKLRWIVIPGVNGDVGSRARIIQDAGGGQIEREGRVIKLLADLDAKGKTARLLIEIKDPFALDESTKINVEDNKALNKLPLLLGSYVKVLFEGQTQSGIFALPEGVLREESKVWVRSAEGRLNIRQVKLLWRADGKAYVQGDLSDGDRIITSRIQLPVEGMKLSLIGQTPSQPKPNNAKHPDPDVASSSRIAAPAEDGTQL